MLMLDLNALKTQFDHQNHMTDSLKDAKAGLSTWLRPAEDKAAEVEKLRSQVQEMGALRMEVAEVDTLLAQVAELDILRSQMEELELLTAADQPARGGDSELEPAAGWI
ncbi:hypothetical protein M422DRAFT_268961 [Sphaerobolus stellatus SS14]|uniref:Uncharacterized protein n=1 Tax=Sphaerobolus stellatus (strain SS14) TaxID=990650 RepID=A0A0C9UWS0_SPHS4|nr:hypothetical protein M422DRAFT_268961 [Sphaerobolus stellatus SS14]